MSLTLAAGPVEHLPASEQHCNIVGSRASIISFMLTHPPNWLLHHPIYCSQAVSIAQTQCVSGHGLMCVAGVNVGVTRATVEAVEPGLPDTGNDAGQQQSSATGVTAHKAGVPIAAIAGAAAGGLVALLIGALCCTRLLADQQ